MKLKNASSQYAIYSHSSFGPNFGSGTDLHVNSSAVYLNIGSTYELGPSTPTQLIGGRRYNIKEMEVFQVTDDPTPLQDPRKKQPLSCDSVKKVTTVNIFSKKVNECHQRQVEHTPRA
jgi:hypothetical protein